MTTDNASTSSNPDEPTCSPPGGGRWEWRAGQWHPLPEPTEQPETQPQE